MKSLLNWEVTVFFRNPNPSSVEEQILKSVLGTFAGNSLESWPLNYLSMSAGAELTY